MRNEKLRFVDFPHHWRRVVEGSPSPEELSDQLLAGFWRGELILAAAGAALLREAALGALRETILGAQGIDQVAVDLAFWAEDEEGELGPRGRWLGIYRQKVAALHDALAAEGGLEVQEAIRALVEAVVLVPDGEALAIEVRGDLAAILALGQNANTRPGGRVHDDLLVEVKLVAGAGDHRELMPLRIAV